MANKKTSLRDAAKEKLNADLAERKTVAISRLLNEKRRHEAAIKDIEVEIKGIEESPEDTAFIANDSRDGYLLH